MSRSERKVYIATRLERANHHRQLAHALKGGGWKLSYDWTVHGSVQREGAERIREVALAEARGVAEADAVVVLLPGGRGTHAELGMALALGKPVVVHATEEDGFFADDERTCAFYHHPLVQRVQAPWGICFVDIFDALQTIHRGVHRTRETK